jgi:LuxR family maltose regulon positive regulatory protein
MAVILIALERIDEALAALERALSLAEPQGFMRTFLDEGEPMRELIRLALAEGICKKYSQELLSAFEGQGESAGSRMRVGQVDLIERLSEREMQVLRLLKSRLSVPEIAREIHLAPTTVRTHVQNIYRKLDVHGRIEALQRAEELGLL